MVALTNAVMTVAVTFSKGGGVTVEAGIRATKLPMPIQKAMARPAAKPTSAPWGRPARKRESLPAPLAAKKGHTYGGVGPREEHSQGK